MEFISPYSALPLNLVLSSAGLSGNCDQLTSFKFVFPVGYLFTLYYYQAWPTRQTNAEKTVPISSLQCILWDNVTISPKKDGGSTVRGVLQLGGIRYLQVGTGHVAFKVFPLQSQ